jgi:molybdopterin-guanine dinucleotide biosynthesis protein A
LGGIDKSALLVGGRRIIDRQLEALRCLTDDIAVIGHSPERYEGLAVEVVEDLVPDAGPIGGLYTALVHARAPLVLVLACDLPFVDARVLAHLVARLGQARVCLPRDARGFHPLCACYDRRCAATLDDQLRAGSYKVADALLRLERVDIGPDELAWLDPTGRVLTNVNTADDYSALWPHA